jgi:hypothetical protein
MLKILKIQQYTTQGLRLHEYITEFSGRILNSDKRLLVKGQNERDT